MTILAASAGQRPHPLATAWRGLTAAFRARATSGPAMPTEAMQRPAGGAQIEVLIHRRAVRTMNRKPEAVAAYVARHQALRKG